jgi:hypothetical protein
MANDYFTKTGNPANHSIGSSALVRSEFSAIEQGFDKLPALAGKAGQVVVVNAGASGLEAKTPAQIIVNDATLAATETSTGILELATQAEVDAGADDTRAVTPLKLRNGFAVSLASTGYLKFPTWLGALVIQWGTTTANASGRATGAWPTAFPNSIYVALANGSVGASSTSVRAATRGSATTLTNFDFWLNDAVAHGISYIAIGR